MVSDPWRKTHAHTISLCVYVCVCQTNEIWYTIWNLIALLWCLLRNETHTHTLLLCVHVCVKEMKYDMQSAQEWTNRTPISHELLICSKMCSKKRNQSNNKNEWYNVFVNLYLNSARVYIRLIHVYSVISVNDKRLPGNTKKWTLVRLWLIRVRLVNSWADNI